MRPTPSALLSLAAVFGGAGASHAAGEPPQPYVDRVMDEQALTTADSREPAPAEQGWPRSLSAELQTWHEDGWQKVRNESLLLNGQLDTPDYGAFSFNLNLHRSRNDFLGFSGLGTARTAVSPHRFRNGNTGRIDQRSMPFNGGWLMHNSLGDINTLASPMARGLGRVYLPTLPIEGFASSFEQPGRTQVHVAAGRLGYYEGLDFQGFQRSRGSAVSAGVQHQISGGDNPVALNRSDVALQWVRTSDFEANGVSSAPQDTDSYWAAFAWQGLSPWGQDLGGGLGGVGERSGGLRIQANVARSVGKPSHFRSTAPRDSANGFWLDAQWRGEWLQQSASVFSFDPDLRWGSNAIAGDLRGVAWRGDVATRQWQLGSNVELSERIKSNADRSVFANVFGRYRFDSRDALSGTVAMRTGRSSAQSLQVNWERSSDWGQTLWRAELAHGRGSNAGRLSVDHAWNVGEGNSLSTSLGVERNRADLLSTTSVNYGVVGTVALMAGARLDMGIRGTHHASGHSKKPFLNANARLSIPISAGWSFIAQYSAAKGQESLSPTVVSALTTATQAPLLNRPSQRSLLLALRWEHRAGLSSSPIGGPPGSGAGRVEGHIFLDHNGNGSREASEGGVPDVTLILNQRYVTRTDAQGFYSFPQVAAGHYQVEIVPDNVPLPWAPPTKAQQSVEVLVRHTSRVDFALRRDP